MSESAARIRSVRIRASVMVLLGVAGLSACSKGTEKPMSHPELVDFATRYAAAWSGQDPDALASFYAEEGSLTVNEGTPSVGRRAIADKARGFMEAFPDMVVVMDSVTQTGNQAVFHWTWTGTNTGPGGNGRSVNISGYEEWTLAGELIVRSRGHYDEAEYQRQMSDDSGD